MADLADRDQGDRLVEQAWSLWDGLDAWLHIAGADVLTGPDAHLAFDAKLDRLWAVDVVATMRLCRDVGSKDESPRPRVDRHHGMGPGRDRDGGRLGRALRRDQGGRHGLHSQSGSQPGSDGSRQRARAWMDQDRLGSKRLRRSGKNACSARPLWPGGAHPETWRVSLASWSVPPRSSSPVRSSGSTAERSAERSRGHHGESGVQVSSSEATPRPVSSSSPAGLPSSRYGRCSRIWLPASGSSPRSLVLAHLGCRPHDSQVGWPTPRRSRW